MSEPKAGETWWVSFPENIAKVTDRKVVRVTEKIVVFSRLVYGMRGAFEAHEVYRRDLIDFIERADNA